MRIINRNIFWIWNVKERQIKNLFDILPSTPIIIIVKSASNQMVNQFSSIIQLQRPSDFTMTIDNSNNETTVFRSKKKHTKSKNWKRQKKSISFDISFIVKGHTMFINGHPDPIWCYVTFFSMAENRRSHLKIDISYFTGIRNRKVFILFFFFCHFRPICGALGA